MLLSRLLGGLLFHGTLTSGLMPEDKTFLAKKKLLSPGLFPNASINRDATQGLQLQVGSVSPFERSNLGWKRQVECPVGTAPCELGPYCAPFGEECCPQDPSRGCPIGTICCGDGFCAEEGTKCCPNKGYSCVAGATCCPSGDRNCAPEGGSCCGERACDAGTTCCEGVGCAEEGYKCCEDKVHQCPEGSDCCADACASAGQTCCGDTICFESEQCCNDRSCAPKGAVCCGEGHCQSGETCCPSGKACAKKDEFCCENIQHTCPMGDQCCVDQNGPYCAEKCVETLQFPRYKGITDKIWEHMCNKLKEIYQETKKVEFEWNGGGDAGEKLTNANRRASLRGVNPCPKGFQRDEFPMASVKQGGAGASVRCVEEDTNLFYGVVWNQFLTHQRTYNGLNADTVFRIILEGCDHTDPTPVPLTKRKRADGSDIILNTHGNLTLFSSTAFGNQTNGSNVILIPLTVDNHGAGTYYFNYTLAGGDKISSGMILDTEGQVYETLDGLQTWQSNGTQFTVDSIYAAPVSFMGLTESKDVQMDVNVTGPPPVTTIDSASSSSTAIAAPTGSVNKVLGSIFPIFAGVAIIYM